MCKEFWTDDDGGMGGWSLFLFLISAIVAGLAVDGTNALRAREHLQTTADIAAHAGVVELVSGAEDQEIRDRVSEIVELNLPQGTFGNTLGVQADSIIIGSYSDGVVTQNGSDPDDAVFVSLRFAESNGNAFRTFLLKLVGQRSWDIAASSAASVGGVASCNGNDGIYTMGEIKMTSHAEIGNGFCIYSKDHVELSNHNYFEAGSRIGMPDLADCTKCEDSHNPGIEAAVFEGNLLLENVAAHIDTVIGSLLGTGTDAEPRDDFLLSTTFGSDLTSLDDLGYQVNKIVKGSIISIASDDFEGLASVPSGVIYAVYCSSPLSADGALSPTGSSSSSSNGKGKGNSKSSTTGGTNTKTLSLETGSGAAISDIALVTDCEIDFGRTAELFNSVLVTTSTSNKSINANSKAKIGSSGMTCPSTEKVVIMSKGDMSVPAGMETNNVDFYISGDVHLASGTSKQATKLGTSFYVNGQMHISAQGNWYPCGDLPDSYAADVEAIRQVVASVE